MKTLILLLCLFSQMSFAQTERPNTPYWKLVAELERAGIKPFERYNWSSEMARIKLLNEVPTLNNLKNQIGRHYIVYKMGGENPGKSGFTTVLKNGDIYVQVYYGKPKKNIDVALTLGHELVHASHIDSGLFDDWKGLVRKDKKEYAQCQSEAGAYTWSSIYASNKSDREWIALQIADYQKCAKSLSN